MEKLEEDNGNLLDEIVLDLMSLLMMKVQKKEFPEWARTMMKSVCHKAYVSLVKGRRVCTRKST